MESPTNNREKNSKDPASVSQDVVDKVRQGGRNTPDHVIADRLADANKKASKTKHSVKKRGSPSIAHSFYKPLSPQVKDTIQLFFDDLRALQCEASRAVFELTEKYLRRNVPDLFPSLNDIIAVDDESNDEASVYSVVVPSVTALSPSDSVISSASGTPTMSPRQPPRRSGAAGYQSTINYAACPEKKSES